MPELQTEKLWPHSSNVVRTKYIPETQTLEVEFKSPCRAASCQQNNTVYQYSSFPMELWNELLTTTSIGSFIAQKVKGKFNCVKV